MSLLLAWSMTVTSFLTTEAQADWYVGAYGGLASPGEFSNATLSSATLGGACASVVRKEVTVMLHARSNDIVRTRSQNLSVKEMNCRITGSAQR